jgi:hypothetical protein
VARALRCKGMSPDSNDSDFSRREALRILSQSACVAPVAKIIGVLPAKLSAKDERTGTFTPKFFNADELDFLSLLSELIIPADTHSPGANAALVSEYFDELIAASTREIQEFWRNGLAAIGELAQHAFHESFLRCNHPEQVSLLRLICANEHAPQTQAERFFVALKDATIDGYYNSAIGIHQDLRYQGNTALPSFPGCMKR